MHPCGVRFEEYGSCVRIYHVNWAVRRKAPGQKKGQARTFEWECLDCNVWAYKLKKIKHKKSCKTRVSLKGE